ncbi:MAG: DUF4405 domain-containing protein [Thermoplasmatales archaeon]|nr:MAG: DUF4405 domain-containing protein [Thermoplasmatales archaeon]
MSEGKKSKLKKMEKLRQILDNPSDSEIKKSISKDDKIFETIRRKLSDETSISKPYVASSEFLAKKSDSREPRVDIHTKEEEITHPKQFEVTEEAGGVKDKPVEEDLFDAKDLYEVEKVDVSEPKFLEVKPKDMDRKDKMVVFQELDEIYRKTKIGVSPSDKIRMYRPVTIFEMWAFTLTLGVVAVSGLFLIRDWLFLNFGVYGDKLIPTPEGTQNIHIWFGFAFAVLGLFHLAIHIFSKKKDILPKQTLRDFKSFLYSGMYLIRLARRESYGAGRFYGRQRIIYLALVYILGLTILTGLLYYMNILSSDLVMVHVIPAGLSIMVLLFHFLITIRKHDTIALNCAFISGKLPRWYVRKNHPIWYEQMRTERESTVERLPHSITVQTDKTLIGGSDLNNAVFKFALLFNNSPDIEDIKAFTENLQATIHPDNLQRIIELAAELKDESEEESKHKALEEPQQSEEKSTSQNKHLTKE